MRILVIDDDPDLLKLISIGLKELLPQASIVQAMDGASGVDLARSATPDIVLLDVGLPDMDGFQVCEKIRKESEVPIVMLTVHRQEEEKARALNLGADGFVIKPFSFVELVARIKAVLRRVGSPAVAPKANALHLGELSVDFDTRQVTRNGSPIHLSPIEFDLLSVLAKNAGKVVARSDLLNQVWGADYEATNEYLKTYIKRLRDKIEPDPAAPRYILTHRAVGYRLTATGEEG